MTCRIILSPDAEADIASAIAWYQRIQLSLAFRFKAETRATLRRIARFPHQFPLIDGKVRRARVRGFRYAILYSLEKEGVFIKAIVHDRQDDSTWKNRGNGHS
jgi:toxin ParE1/3/4